MPVHNADIASAFERIADLLEIRGANPFRVRAYRNAARTLRNLPHAVTTLVAEGKDLSELPAIGEDLAAKIEEFVDSGELSVLQELAHEVPAGLIEVLGVPGLGPKRVQALHRELGIETLDDLERAAEAGRIRALAGFGEKSEANIRRELATRGSGEHRTLLPTAEAVAAPLLDYLRGIRGVGKVTIAGSYRRRKETVGDLDILVTCRRGARVTDRFVAYEDVRDVVSKGDTRSTVVLRNGLQVDLRVVEKPAYGAALHYFTGSKAHNIHVRRMGQARGLKVNEYGVFRGEHRVAGKREEEIYALFDMPVIPPELREDRGEIRAAQENRLPKLIECGDLRGDLHAHTDASDGSASVKAMAEAARERGLEYLAITDHSQAVTVANGLDAERLSRQIDAIDDLNDRLDGITLLKSCEVDILSDGRLDLPDDILARLDLTVCAVHSDMKLPQNKQTERIMRAMDNPHFSILAHPTGRLIGKRGGYAVDMARLIKHAANTGSILEVNAQPRRLDLDDIHCKMARDAGVKLAISTDAHAESHLDLIRYGVDQARRGWVTATDVVNTWPLSRLRKLVHR